jgi:DNA modification methylase
MGSGSTAVAAVRADRRYVGYDTDPAYVALAEKRVAEAQELVDTSVTEVDAPEGDREGDPS